jgi:hypothetical protein
MGGTSLVASLLDDEPAPRGAGGAPIPDVAPRAEPAPTTRPPCRADGLDEPPTARSAAVPAPSP